MKKWLIIITGVFSFVADIITLTSAFKWLLVNWFGMSIESASNVNLLVLIVATILLLIIFSYLLNYVWEKYADAGPNGVACAIIPYWHYKIHNRNNTLLRALHCNLYHSIADFEREVKRMKQQNVQNQQNRALTVNDVEPQITNLLRSFHSVLYDVFHVDLSINVYLAGTEDNQTILSRTLFLQSIKEQNQGEHRIPNYKYIVQNCNNQDMEAYAINARNYCNLNPNGLYRKNCVFDYVLSTNNRFWLSNDLSIEERKGQFFSSSTYYRRNYKSLAVFAIIPPSNGNTPANAIKGVLTFDTHNTRKFSKDECTMLMGLMAHILYKVLDDLN